MAKRKQWKQPEAPEVAAEAPEPAVEQKAEPTSGALVTLDEAKAIVNRAVQPGFERDRPSLELLDAAKAIVNAAVQPKAPV
jgi:hypothetical protein